MTFVSHHRLLTIMGALILVSSFAPSAVSVIQKAAQEDNRADFDRALEFTLKYEGGFSDHPEDQGGRTNMGVTQSTYNAFRAEHGLSSQDVANITKEEVRKIYYKNFWKRGNCDRYDAPLSLACLDSVINFGVDGGKSFFNELPDDATQAAIEVVKRRIAYRHQRVAENGSQKVFLNGWLNRDNALNSLVRSPVVVASQPEQNEAE